VTLIFDLLTLKLVCELHQRWGTFLPNLGTLGLWFSDYSLCTRRMDGQTDRRTDGRMKATLIALFPTGGGHNKHDRPGVTIRKLASWILLPRSDRAQTLPWKDILVSSTKYVQLAASSAWRQTNKQRAIHRRPQTINRWLSPQRDNYTLYNGLDSYT